MRPMNTANKRIVVTGTKGQVALSLVEVAVSYPGIEIVLAGRPELDLTSPESVREVVSHLQPSAIISAAAYTNVDGAESDAATAAKVNTDGARALAHAAVEVGIPLIHLSTDYVFDGQKPGPYKETDQPAPINVYGATKLEGERIITETCADCVILRTSWIFSPFGKNFVRTMLSLASIKTDLHVVDDQYGSPTSAHEIARACLQVLHNLWSAPDDARLRGIFHMSCEGYTNWADFAREIFSISATRGGPSAFVHGIRSDEYPTVARRPTNSRLDCSRLREVHGISLPSWQASLKPVVERLISQHEGIGK